MKIKFYEKEKKKKIEAKGNQRGEKQLGDIRSNAERRAEQNTPQIMTILRELREGTAFRDQMPKNNWPKEQKRK